MLATRIAGYRVEIRRATDAEVHSWIETAESMAWSIPSADPKFYSQAQVGKFVAESGNVMDLPYELRSTVMRPNGDMLEILEAHVADLKARVLDASAFCECYRDAKTCDNCKIDTAIQSRLYSAARGNAWKSKAQASNGRALFPRVYRSMTTDRYED